MLKHIKNPSYPGIWQSVFVIHVAGLCSTDHLKGVNLELLHGKHSVSEIQNKLFGQLFGLLVHSEAAQ